MTKITLDTDACDQLGKVDGCAEICDEQGNVIGCFFAGELRPGQPPPGLEIPLSIEEIQRRRGTRTGRTAQEILRGLGLA